MLETAKYAVKLGSKKFQHILNDHAIEIVNIDGEEFSECDYGLVVDYSGSSLVKDKIEAIAQAAMQNQMTSFSTMLQIYNNNNSIADIQRMVELDESNRLASSDKARQEENQLRMAEIQANNEQNEANRDVLIQNNIRDNQTKLLLKQIELQNEDSNSDGVEEPDTYDKDKLLEQIREFDQRLALDKQKHNDEMALRKEDLQIKRISANKPRNTQ